LNMAANHSSSSVPPRNVKDPVTVAASLDFAFLEHIGVSLEGEAALHDFYLPMLAGRRRVLDLGCGLGGFVQLLNRGGFEALGVDSDPACIAFARAHGLPVAEADVLEYLREAPAGSWDAVVAAHLVEHMPYAAVLELVQQAYRVLKPEGRLLLITPNPQALVAHLELYPMHFGHVAMYHPELLAFFMAYSGFAKRETGENPKTTTTQVAGKSPLRVLEQARVAAAELSHARPTPAQVLPPPKALWRRAIWQVKMALVHWLVQPYFEHTMQEIRQTGTVLEQTLGAVDRPFECYAVGDKPAQQPDRPLHEQAVAQPGPVKKAQGVQP
jgi:SAM-dependent methyltransferase